MTAQEKAKELVNNMFNCDKSTPEESMAMLLIHAKQCALIAVDEIINTNSLANRTCGYLTLTKEHLQYWQQVKHEIEQL